MSAQPSTCPAWAGHDRGNGCGLFHWGDGHPAPAGDPPGLEAFTHGAVREALRHIVGVQLRNLATVGGSIYSRFGFSDVLTLFLAMDCSVELYKGGIVPLREYAERPYDRDIVVRLLVRKEAADYCYQSVRNSQTDIPVLTCAAARLQDGSYRFAVGARPLKAVLYEEPAAPAQQLAETIQQQVVTGSNMRGSADTAAT